MIAPPDYAARRADERHFAGRKNLVSAMPVRRQHPEPAVTRAPRKADPAWREPPGPFPAHALEPLEMVDPDPYGSGSEWWSRAGLLRPQSKVQSGWP